MVKNICFVIVFFVLCISPLFAQDQGPIRERSYLPLEDDIANPERGFMHQESIFPDQPFDPGKIRVKSPTDTIEWIYVRLDNYRNKPLDAVGLSTIRSVFSTAREKGIKLVIRFMYNWGPGWTNDPHAATADAPLPLALQHLSQVGPLIREHKDVIFLVEAGSVGHWGEWHSSKYLYAPESKKAILDVLLTEVPDDRMITVRYPRYKELFFQGPLSASEYFSRVPKSRIGHHDDCFLSGAYNEGTYRSTTSQPPSPSSRYCAGKDEITCWKDFISKESKGVPVGGETCSVSTPYTDCANALKDLEQLGWTFLNNGYHPDVLHGWTAQGCMTEIRKRLGYRFSLSSSRIPVSVSAGSTFDAELSLQNVGYAPLYNPRPVYLVLMSGGTRHNILLSTIDPRKWAAGAIHVVPVRTTLPSDIVPGVYDVGIWMPDASDTISSRVAYAVRFANQGTWQSQTGVNVLGTVQIGTASVISQTPVPLSATGVVSPSPQGCVTPAIGRLTCFEVWRREFRSEVSSTLSDYTADGRISLSDFEVWRRVFR